MPQLKDEITVYRVITGGDAYYTENYPSDIRAKDITKLRMSRAKYESIPATQEAYDFFREIPNE